jgi:hypothetical protein
LAFHDRSILNIVILWEYQVIFHSEERYLLAINKAVENQFSIASFHDTSLDATHCVSMGKMYIQKRSLIKFGLTVVLKE